MLTKDLLVYRILKGQVRPTFVDRTSPELLALAQAMVQVAASAAGSERGDLEEQLSALTGAFPKPKVADGLAKLLVDRMEFEEPSDEAEALRFQAFDEAAKLLRSLPDDAPQADYEALLGTFLPRPVGEVRAQLYGDHPEHRRMLSWKPLDAQELVDRYNLALVQGLLLRASSVTVRAQKPEILRVRRVLRWLKFCRLVAEVQRDGDDWSLVVEGPAAILQMQKKYGLQLAMFVAVVPVLARWQLEAEITFDRARSAPLRLDDSSPLVSPHASALGYVPPEIEVIAQKLEGGRWTLDLTPTPRTVGAGRLCVPDLSLLRDDGKVSIALEVFHRWHRHQLERRLEDLRVKPDPHLFLAVEEPLLSDPEVRVAAEEQPQLFTFKTFPSERKIRQILAAFE